MRTLLLLLSCTLFQTLTAQNATLKGKVTDIASGEPLIGVSVKAGTAGTATDYNGGWSFSLPAGTYEVSFNFVGFEPKTQSVRLTGGQTTELNIQLGDANNLLQQATVTAGKFEKPLGEVTVSLDVVKPKLIESINSTSVDRVLDKVPGVSILDGQVSIRGGSGFSYGAGTRVLLLVDDIPAMQPDAAFPNWNDFPVENIAQIEVLKGAASALYGSSAMNGIINIRTGYAKDKPETEIAVFSKLYGDPKDPAKKWWGRDSSGLKQPLQTGISFVHRRKFNKLDLVLSGYGLFHDSYNRQTYERYGRFSPNIRYRFSDRLSVSLNTDFNVGRSGSFFYWAGDGAGNYQTGGNSATKSLGHLRFTLDPTIQYYDKAGFRHKFLGRLYYVHNNNDANQSNDSRMWYGEYQVQRQFSDLGLVLTGGVVGIYTDIRAKLYNNADYTSRNLSGYMQLDYKVFSRLNISAGMRYEQNLLKSPDTVYILANQYKVIPNGETKEAKPVYRIGLNYQVAKGTYVRASYGQGYRYPTVAEKFINTAFGGNYTVRPNPDLVSETGWTEEVGVKQGFKLWGWQGFLDLTAFVSDYHNMMEFGVAGFDPTTFGFYFQSRNTGDTHIAGQEISIAGQGKVGGGTLSILAGYTHVDPKYKQYDKDTLTHGNYPYEKNVLKYRYRHIVKWDSEYSYKKFSAGLSVLYNSNIEAIDYIFFTLPGMNTFMQNHSHGYKVIDLRASYQVSKHLKISGICANIFNEEYTVRPALLEAPRNFTVRLDWKL